MSGFKRPGRAPIESKLTLVGRGSISAALFDLGIYPAAVPAADSRVIGEIYELTEPVPALRALDELEGYRPSDPETSLYTRTRTPVAMEDGSTVEAWTYFYNAPLGRAERIESGDYLEHLKVR